MKTSHSSSFMSTWQPLTGKLDKQVVTSAKAIAVRHNNGNTAIKETTKDTLWQYDLSIIIKEYKVL